MNRLLKLRLSRTASWRALPVGVILLTLWPLSGCVASEIESASANSAPVAVAPEVPDASRIARNAFLQSELVRNVVIKTNPNDFWEIDYINADNGSQNNIVLYTILPATISVTYSPGDSVMSPGWKVSWTDYIKMHEVFYLSSSWSQSDAQAAA